MKRFNQTSKSICIGLIYSMSCASPVFADDIEIYTSLGSGTVAVKPNVLFVLDNSGSMQGTVPNLKERFNVANSYTGCFDGNKVYYSSNGSEPACGSTDFFDLSDLHCDHAHDEYNASGVQISSNGPIEVWGTYADQMAQHSTANVWGKITANNRPVECAQDQGIHGDNSSPTTERYIANTVTGWQSPISTPTVWGGGKNNYTLYHGKYLNYLMDTSVPILGTAPTRFTEVTRAISALIDTNTAINVGLIAFDEYNGAGFPLTGTNKIDGGEVVYPMEDVNTGRTNFKAAMGGINANTGTPLSETYYEALRYYGGLTPQYGAVSNPPSVVSSISGGNYISPITDQCQKNSIIVLTDGQPTRDNLTVAEVSQLPGYTDMSCTSTSNSPSTATNCMDEMALWAFTNDVVAGTSSATTGTQTITTHTVGFADPALAGTAGQFLRDTAANGNGQFVFASDADKLRSDLSKLFADILEVNTTFSSPAVSVNAFNRSTHLEDLYFSLFVPGEGSHWDGNLKKYKITFDTNANPIIEDSLGNDAIDAATGFFNATSKSFWTDGAVDGDDARLGGVAKELTATRNIYTISGSYAANTTGVNVPNTNGLTAASNALDKANANITDALLGVTTKAPIIGSIPYRETLLDWASGLDVLDEDNDASTTIRQKIGDPLHAEPALVQYGELAGNVPDLVAYVATNDGYLHAFDTVDGSEYFSFVPQELLTNLDVIFENGGAFGKAYGLDGDVVPWINDADRDGTIGSGEHVYLYMGMRRGGNNIYSLDVTDRNNPVMRWVIKGGTGDYTELAQTWSSVNVEKIDDGTADGKTVLIVGGGYDENQDFVSQRTVDTVGRAVYVIDADTGDRLWWAGPSGSGADVELSEMNYSIPARIKPLDIDGDGFIDRLYAADMGAQLWRFDIPDDNLSNITGGRIADLAQDASVTDARRLYYPPDVSLIFEEGKAPYLAIVAATGYRAHPLDEVIQDRIYMIRDYDIYSTPTSYVTITESDLFDTTLNIIGEGNTTQIGSAVATLNSKQGWFITLDDEANPGSFIGEKTLSEPLILDGTAIVTTYIPRDLFGSTPTDACAPRAGTGSVFFVNITDGTPTYDLSKDGDKTREDRRQYLKHAGIPPSPNIIVTKDGTAQCVGTECAKTTLIQNTQKTYWHEQEK